MKWRKKPVLKKIAAAVLVLLSLGAPVSADSTDPLHPTPWPAGGVRGGGTGGRITYYYDFNAGVGDMTVRVEARARVFSTGVAVDFTDETGYNFSRAGAIATSGGAANDSRIHLAAPHHVLVAVSLDENLGSYAISINPPAVARRPVRLPRTTEGGTPDGRPWPGIDPGSPRVAPAPGSGSATGGSWPSYGINGSGDGAEHTYTYTLEAGPGDVTIHVQGRARTLSTAVTAGLYDAGGNLLREVGAIATGTDVREAGTIRLTVRQTCTLRIHVDANVGPYSVWIDR